MSAASDDPDEHGERDERGGARLPLACAALFALCALAAAGAHAGLLPRGCGGPAALPVVLFGAAFPLLLRWSPVEPSPLKVLLFGGLCAPFVFGALLAAARFAGLAESALTAAFVAVALLQVLAVGRRMAFEPLGRAAWGALLLALGAAGGLGWLLLGDGDAPRQLHAGAAWHAGVAQMLARGGSLENPWMAGEPLPGHPGHAWLVSVFARGLDWPATRAQAGVAIWACASVPLSVYLWAAPLWRSAARSALAPLFALIGWNAVAGLGALEAPAGAWAQALATATPGAAPGQVLYGGAAFFAVGPLGAGLALSVAAWTAAAHALRHGARPWTGLCALLHGAAFALAPLVGGVALACTLLVALAHPGRSDLRARVPLVLLLWALPGLALARAFGSAGSPVMPTYGLFSAAALLPGLGLGLCCLALAVTLGPVLGAQAEDARGRRTILLSCVAGVALPCAAIWVHDAPRLESAALLRLASFPLAVLAAGGVGGLLERRGPAWRALGAAALCALLVGGARVAQHAWGAHRAFASLSSPIADDSGRELVTKSALNDVRAAYAFLRAQADPRGVLLRSPAEPSEHPAGHLVPHFAPLFANLPLWVDHDSAWSPLRERWLLRHDRTRQLFTDPKGWDPHMRAELEACGRPIYVLVTEEDRRTSHRGGPAKQPRGVDDRLAKLGARPVFALPLVRVYLFDQGAKP